MEVRQIQVMDDIHRRGEHPASPREPVTQYEVGGSGGDPDGNWEVLQV